MKHARARLLMALAVILCAVMMIQYSGHASDEAAVFSWFPDYEREDFLKDAGGVLKRYRITAVYQYVQAEQLSSDAFVTYAGRLAAEGIALYLLYDDQRMNAADFRRFVGRIHKSPARPHIKGIVTDVEPFSFVRRQSAPADTLSRLTAFLSKCSAAAREAELHILHCVPTWYDTISTADCERIISGGDGVVLMNYRKADMIDAIAFEAEAAFRHRKTVVSALELDPVNAERGITEATTFHGASAEELSYAVERVQKQYPGIVTGYHQLRDLVDMRE